MTFTVVVPYYNGHKTIGKLVECIPDNIPVIIVDDKSEVPVPISEFSREVRVLPIDEKGYFTGAVNYGIEHLPAGGDVLILNQDVHFTDGRWLEVIEITKEDLFGEGITGKHPAWTMGYIHGTFMYIRQEAYQTVGPLNAKLYPLWGSTCEYQLRAVRCGFSARPLEAIPGMVHRRVDIENRYGSAISTVLKKEPSRIREFITTPPEVSIIIPCYNYGKYLVEAVRSVLEQSFQSTEIIIVDDASTDEYTRDVLLSLNKPMAGICVKMLPNNVGTAQAINEGIKSSHGKYISILSADDKMLPHRIEDMYTTLQAHKLDKYFAYDDLLLFGDCVDKDFPGTATHLASGYKIHLLPLPKFEEMIYKNGIHAGIFMPREAWAAAGGYPSRMGRGREDWAFNVALYRAGYKPLKTDNPGYLYRRDCQNRSLVNSGRDARRDYLMTMQALYPELYNPNGDNNMAGCCGGNNMVQSNTSNWTAGAKSVPGATSGWEKVEYLGTQTAPVTYWGTSPETRGIRYTFGGSRRVGFIDSRDVPGFLQKEVNGKKEFKLVVEQEVQLVEVRSAQKVTHITAEEVIEREEYLKSLVSNPENHRIDVIKEELDNLTDENIRDMYSNELNGKQRTTLLEYLYDILNPEVK